MDDRDDSHEPGETGDAGGDRPPGVEQLQRAALEAVEAARAVLDVAESMIREPAAVEALVNTVTAMARTATESVAGFAAGVQHQASRTAAPDATSDAEGQAPGGNDDPGYQRITVE